MKSRWLFLLVLLLSACIPEVPATEQPVLSEVEGPSEEITIQPMRQSKSPSKQRNRSKPEYLRQQNRLKSFVPNLFHLKMEAICPPWAK
jgi:hypothetical protein